jgi:hypothetical protein
MLSILSDTQKAVVDTIIMKLKLSQALEYMEHADHKMSERSGSGSNTRNYRTYQKL